MQNINIELFSRLFLLNLSNTFRKNGVNNNEFSIVSDSNSSHSGSGLEPPTPPRTPVISGQKINEKNFNNNNEDSKENYGGNSSSFLRNSTNKSIKSESDFESSSRRSSHFHDDSNHSEDGRESVASGSHMNGNEDDSDREESDFGTFEKISMKNIEKFLDKSSLVSFFVNFVFVQ